MYKTWETKITETDMESGLENSHAVVRIDRDSALTTAPVPSEQQTSDGRSGASELALKETVGLEWQDEANCLGVDPDLFFPERGASTREAKEVCRMCVVRTDCLEYAIANGEKFGVWGGLSERERRRLRRQRAQAAKRTQA
jgi:WhiB family redox-sensing transcriptional regulator